MPQSLYSMNVLPAAATLGSFFVVLVCVTVSTIVVAANLRLFPIIFDSVTDLRSYLNPARLAPLVRSVFAPIFDLISETEWWDMEEVAWTRKLTKSRVFRYIKMIPCCSFPATCLFVMMQILLWALPRNEFMHCSGLFFRPSEVVYNVKFSWYKLFGDLIRLILFPLWIGWFLCAVGLFSIGHGIWFCIHLVFGS